MKKKLQQIGFGVALGAAFGAALRQSRRRPQRKAGWRIGVGIGDCDRLHSSPIAPVPECEDARRRQQLSPRN